MSMPHHDFLFTTIAGGGVIPPTMEVVSRLTQRGHRVRVMSQTVSRAEIERVGAVLVPWTRTPDRSENSRETAFQDWKMSAPEALRLLNEMLSCGAALPFAQDVMDELRREPTDVIVNFDPLFGAAIAAEALGTKLALFSTGLSLAPLPGVPPVGSGLPPAQSPAETAELDRITDFIWSGGLSPLNQARVALGLKPLDRVVDQFARCNLYLIGTARAFDFPSTDLPPRVRYTGPLIRTPLQVRSWSSPWPKSDLRPLIVIGFSTTFQNHVGCLQRVINACADLPVRALVTLGGAVYPNELKAAPNTVVVESAPHDVIMRSASLVITHGGHGTVMTALMHRVPILVIPHGRDQGDNALRIATRGAGLALPSNCFVDEMRVAIARILDEPAFRTNARCLGDAVAHEAGQATFVDDLETLAIQGDARARAIAGKRQRCAP
jgi:MGT family glycosyltransferase